MPARTLMLLGTASSVGKSLLVTALCRIFAREGLRVAPFKAQNMALNSYVTREGHEMGRAQVAQAQAAMVEPHVDMNPILLKPEADSRSQVVLMGRPWRTIPARSYYRCRKELWAAVTAALDRLRAAYDLVIIEGAGSPVELNLKGGDIVNMAVARHAQAPVLLVGDIDRGGIFAQLLGTLWLLEPEERGLVRGLIVNKFRGDLALFEEGVRILEERGGVPVLGVIPYLPGLRIAQEDSVFLEDHRALGEGQEVDIAVIRLPHISNYDDFDALAMEEGVRVRFVESVEELGQPDAVILPGSKTTLDDLRWLRSRGLDGAIVALAGAGKAVAGICGGYQMLGRLVRDALGIEGRDGAQPGLGLLPVDTDFEPEKATFQVWARVIGGEGFLARLEGIEVEGYEIHMGRSRLLEGTQPLLRITRRGGEAVDVLDGAVSVGGRVWGTYLHGIFDNPAFRRAWLRSLGWRGEGPGETLAAMREREYDRLADHVQAHLDMARLREIIGL
ncbi:MAG: cobyric acid synthase [Anaerolineae bacterium]|nr:cobyric acid synthase [Anaerolineae bacterium]